MTRYSWLLLAAALLTIGLVAGMLAGGAIKALFDGIQL